MAAAQMHLSTGVDREMVIALAGTWPPRGRRAWGGRRAALSSATTPSGAGLTRRRTSRSSAPRSPMTASPRRGGNGRA
eukprot:1233212-Pyramimonas_sp.AAC.1